MNGNFWSFEPDDTQYLKVFHLTYCLRKSIVHYCPFHGDLRTIYGLPPNVYERACMKLNVPTPDGDCEVLAQYMGYSTNQIARFKLSKNPTDAILFHWVTQRGNELKRLTEILKKIKRHDVVEILEAKDNLNLHCNQQSKTAYTVA